MPQPQKPSAAAPLVIVRPRPFYSVGRVMLPYDGGIGDVQITPGLLDDGTPRTQEGWARRRAQTGLGPGSGPLIFSVWAALYDNRGREDVEELRKLFAGDSVLITGTSTFGMIKMTSTRVTYRAVEGLDVVTHDFGAPSAKSLEACLVGPDGPLDDSGVAYALFGSRDVGQVNDVFKWVTGHELPLWRLNKKPAGHTMDIEWPLLLGLCLDVAGKSYASASVIGNGLPARGMRVVPQGST